MIIEDLVQWGLFGTCVAKRYNETGSIHKKAEPKKVEYDEECDTKSVHVHVESTSGETNVEVHVKL